MIKPDKLKKILDVKEGEPFAEAVSYKNNLIRFYIENSQLIIDEKNSSKQTFDYFNVKLIKNTGVKYFHKTNLNETFLQIAYSFGYVLDFTKK